MHLTQSLAEASQIETDSAVGQTFVARSQFLKKSNGLTSFHRRLESSVGAGYIICTKGAAFVVSTVSFPVMC